MTGWGPGAWTFFCLWWSVAPVVGQALGWSGSWILYGAAQDSKIVCIDNLACEEALLFGRAKRVSRERANGEAASGRGKERLQRSLIKFHLYFAQTKGKYNWLKNDVPKNKVNWLQAKLAPPSSVCQVWFSGGSDWYRELVSAFKADEGARLIYFLQREYYEPRICRTEFIVLVEAKWKPFFSCIRLCQASCLVLKTRRMKVKRDSSSRFKRCLPTSVSSPHWIPLGRKIQKHVLDSVST